MLTLFGLHNAKLPVRNRRADKVFVMDDGKLIMEGTPREIFSKVDKIKKIGLEVPQVTELGHLLRTSGLNINEGILSIDELVNEIKKAK